MDDYFIKYNAIASTLTSNIKDCDLSKKYEFSLSSILGWKIFQEDDDDFWKRIVYEYLKRYNDIEDGKIERLDIFTEEELGCSPEMNRTLFDISATEYNSFKNSKKMFKKVIYGIINTESTFILKFRLNFIKNCIRTEDLEKR